MAQVIASSPVFKASTDGRSSADQAHLNQDQRSARQRKENDPRQSVQSVDLPNPSFRSHGSRLRFPEIPVLLLLCLAVYYDNQTLQRLLEHYETTVEEEDIGLFSSTMVMVDHNNITKERGVLLKTSHYYNSCSATFT